MMTIFSLLKESWDKSYPEPDLRLIIIDGTKEEEGWQAPAVLNDKAINMLEEAGWGLCHMEMPDYMKKQTIPQVVSRHILLDNLFCSVHAVPQQAVCVEHDSV